MGWLSMMEWSFFRCAKILLFLFLLASRLDLMHACSSKLKCSVGDPSWIEVWAPSWAWVHPSLTVESDDVDSFSKIRLRMSNPPSLSDYVSEASMGKDKLYSWRVSSCSSYVEIFSHMFSQSWGVASENSDSTAEKCSSNITHCCGKIKPFFGFVSRNAVLEWRDECPANVLSLHTGSHLSIF